MDPMVLALCQKNSYKKIAPALGQQEQHQGPIPNVQKLWSLNQSLNFAGVRFSTNKTGEGWQGEVCI